MNSEIRMTRLSHNPGYARIQATSHLLTDSEGASRPSLRAQPASPQTGLRFGIAPERVEVFDPVDLASPDFAERMMEIGQPFADP